MENEVKIIINNPMFVKGSILVLWEDGSSESYTLDPATVIRLANKYECNKVYVKGNKIFNQKVIKKIQEEELLTYRENLIEFINLK